MRLSRKLRLLMVLLTLATAHPAGALNRRVAKDVPDSDRPGHDYKVFAEHDVAQCFGACLFDSACAAYSLVPPSPSVPAPACHLKNAVSPREHKRGYQSGVIKGFPDTRHPTPVPTVQPPPSPDKIWCSTAAACPGLSKGRWNTELNQCDCPVPSDPPNDPGIPDNREADAPTPEPTPARRIEDNL